MIIKKSVNCANCDEEIIQEVLYAMADKEVVINSFDFAQTSWHCGGCGHTSSIGDIDVVDVENL